MSAELLAVLQKLEKDDIADLSSLLVPALFAEIQALSKANATVSSVEAVVFAAVEPAAQAAFASLMAKIPVVA